LGTARAGQRVFGRATPAHAGGTPQVWDVDVANEDAARAIGLFRCTQLVMYPRESRQDSGVSVGEGPAPRPEAVEIVVAPVDP
jgi:hypothetical protein